jgi:hypothetical protein
MYRTSSSPNETLSSPRGSNAAFVDRPKLLFVIVVLLSILSNTRVIRHLSLQAGRTAEYQHLKEHRNESHVVVLRTAEAAGNVTTPSVDDITTTNSSTTTSSLASSLPLCGRDEIRIGSWQPVTLKAPPYVPSTVHLRCYPEHVYQQNYWNTFDWQPASLACQFAEWNPKEFCKLLFRATILVIGDSLSWEHYRSLNHLLGNRAVHQSDQHQSKKAQGNVVQYVCPRQQTRLVFRRDDLLTNVTQAIFDEGTFPHVIVMNRGAHYKNDSLLLDGVRQVTQEIQAWQEECRQRNVACHFFWRTSVPGHPQCNHTATSFSEPVNDLAEMEAFIADRSLYNNRTLGYHWFDYQHQNLLVEDLLKQELGQENQSGAKNDNHKALQILDAYYLNVLRPDEHRAHQGDCLHNCYPGKMDVYSRMLLHYLLQQRTQKDVDDLIAWQDEHFGSESNNGSIEEAANKSSGAVDSTNATTEVE